MRSIIVLNEKLASEVICGLNDVKILQKLKDFINIQSGNKG